jgi:NADH-quinone oxidoreductase subunit L
MTDSARYIWLIPLFPLLGAFVNATVGYWIQKRLGRVANGVIANATVWASFALSAFFFAALSSLPEGGRALQDRVYTWISAGGFTASVSFTIDPLSAVMILIVTGVGGLIHLYSIGYMAHERSVWRYFSYLNLFTFSMLVLVLADNLLLMFVGWEGVGLCSYLLIGFWYEDRQKAAAGMKAFIVNRIGDFAFLTGMMFLLWGMPGRLEAKDAIGYTGGPLSLDFSRIAEAAGSMAGREIAGAGLVTIICLAFFGGAAGKSAQFPLYVWLPDAMAGPTPVSALIHAATMVTAGVYMIARLNFLFALSPAALTVVSGVGAATALFAATIGLVQKDIKKVLAYSTVSQLGFMFIGVGVAAFSAGIFHLMTHAFFKACLFLGAGSVIHAMGGEQDIFKMGGLRSKLPKTFWTFLLATLAIAGLPGFSGFFSKDLILWKAFETENTVIPWWPYAIWGAGVLAALGTSFYMFRLVYLVFSGKGRGPAEVMDHVHESPRTMTLPLVVLAILATVGGLVGLPELTGLPDLIRDWLAPVVGAGEASVQPRHVWHGMEPILSLFMIGIALGGLLFARAIYKGGNLDKARAMAGRHPLLHRIVLDKYYVDEIYGVFVVEPFMYLSRVLNWLDARVVDGAVNLAGAVTKVFAAIDGAIDRYIVDGSVNLVAWLVVATGRKAKMIQTGRLQDYIYIMAAGAALILAVSRLA